MNELELLLDWRTVEGSQNLNVPTSDGAAAISGHKFFTVFIFWSSNAGAAHLIALPPHENLLQNGQSLNTQHDCELDGSLTCQPCQPVR